MKSKGLKRGFTIIELLTVMSIIVVLMGILMPSFAAIRRYAKAVKQKGAFHDIATGLEMFSIDFDGYPDSKGTLGTNPGPYNLDVDGAAYCGAIRLCEAMFGKDGFGFHPESRFTMNGASDSAGTINYYPKPITDENRRQRKHPYIDTDKHKTTRLSELYDVTQAGCAYSADPCETVICDVFSKVKGRTTGAKIGLPILYYKADTTKLGNDPNDDHFVPQALNIYDLRDNRDIDGLVVDGITGANPLHDGITTAPTKTASEVFYSVIRDKKFINASKPYNENSYILISAGWDGLYGTKDDVYNFGE